LNNSEYLFLNLEFAQALSDTQRLGSLYLTQLALANDAEYAFLAAVHRLGRMATHVFDLELERYPKRTESEVFDAVSSLVELLDEKTFVSRLQTSQLSSEGFAVDILKSTIDEVGLANLGQANPLPVAGPGSPMQTGDDDEISQPLDLPISIPSLVPPLAPSISISQVVEPVASTSTLPPLPATPIAPPMVASTSRSSEASNRSKARPTSRDRLRSKRSLLALKAAKDRKGQ
jgi:hypothetical protein